MLPTLPALNPPHIETIQIVIQKEEPAQPVTHTVVSGDNLTKLSEAYSVPLDRLWSANPQLQHPDILDVNEQLNIPSNTDVLTHREMPSTIQMDSDLVRSDNQKAPSNRGSSGLIGSIGYARAGGNCVDEPGVNSPRNGTNPISWQVLSRTPWIGASALHVYNHVSVVVGIWSDGSVEVRHQNFRGSQTRFYPHELRGFR